MLNHHCLPNTNVFFFIKRIWRTGCRAGLKSTTPLFPLFAMCLLITCTILGACNDQSTNTDTAQPLRIAAAASVARVLENLSQHPDAPVAFTVNAGASGTLARQIQLGAPADIFISADSRWIDTLIAHQHADPSSRRTIAANHLVVASSTTSSTTPPATWPSIDPLTETTSHPIAIGETQTVPLGHYTQQALQHAKIWRRIEPHAVMAPNATAAVAYVARSQCNTGIIYASDAHSNPNLHTLWNIDPAWHDPITIQIIATRASQASSQPPSTQPATPTTSPTQQLINWLVDSPAARAEFSSAGFDVNLTSP